MKPQDVLALYQTRKRSRAPVIERAREITAHYEGRVAVPLPEMAANERVAVANLINQGIDAHAQRIASTQPDAYFPSLKPGQKSADRAAKERRRALMGWWEANELDLKDHRRARWFVAYAAAPVIIRPDIKRGIPLWHLRSPLETYPAPTANYDEMCPDDAIFAFRRSVGWVNMRYPEASVLATFAAGNAIDSSNDRKVTLLEYADAEEMHLIIVGETSAQASAWGEVDVWAGFGGNSESAGLMNDSDGKRWFYIELENVPNRAGMCPVVMPGRVTLDQPIGQFDEMIGLFQQQALLMAMEVHAVRNSVWPDTWMVGRQNETPQIIEMADGPAGVIGIVQGGDLKDINHQPGMQTYPTVDRLERSQRLAGGIPAEFGGESTSNIRTGRRGDQVLSAVVDFPIMEAQKIFDRSRYHEDIRAIAIAKAYFGNARKTFYVSWRGAKGMADYVPNDIFTTDFHEVHHSHPGTDANGLVIGGGQRVGLGTLSKKSFMRLDPLVDDPEIEHDQVLYEALETSILAELSQPGSMAVVDKGRIMELVLSDMPIFQAVATAQQEAQARQATSGQPGTPEGPVPPGSPAAQPGLSPPGMGAEAGSQGGVPTGLAHMTQLLRSMRLGQQQSPLEQRYNTASAANG